MTKAEAEARAIALAAAEPKTTGLTFAARPCIPVPGDWYVAGFYQGGEVAYSRGDDYR